jgi:peptidoglycan/xylan/chitin deacetylase (PgdA/CDA1 family)
VRPKSSTKDFETILDIERRHGFRSTFFILHDRYWARQGARFCIGDPGIHAIVRLIKEAGCEIGLHGGYYRFNDSAAYAESREALQEAFDVEISGIRNHLLRFSGEPTWRAQLGAGFAYDATFGDQSYPGPYGGRDRPFWAIPPVSTEDAGLVELPLTVMDGTLFRHRRLAGRDALDAAWEAISPVIESGGLVSLLWHGNFFNEPEYWDWQWVYEELLDRLAARGPWCGTGAEINAWWRAKQRTPAGS